jgi:hypothetical protein
VSAERPDLFETIFGMPPSLPTFKPEGSNAEYGREFARLHRQGVQALEAIADANGGGLRGSAKGLLDECARRSMITPQDRARLNDVFDLLTTDGQLADETDLVARVQQIQAEIVEDSNSSEIAVAVSSVASESLLRASRDAEQSADQTDRAADPATVAAETAAIVGADTWGSLLGLSTGGAIPGLVLGVGASVGTFHVLHH